VDPLLVDDASVKPIESKRKHRVRVLITPAVQGELLDHVLAPRRQAA